ncbi:class I SAM-dependent methyltransferase [Mesorhizobium sp. M8A.F.Ca.ET.021.01.1.1]|nr:class I SAM-dependent methyltransferase [Mesorhizobium sp. M8A.F.Ca.ET.021.01.1.1]
MNGVKVDTFNFRGYEIPIHLMMLTGGGPETFEEISDKHFLSLRKHVAIEPDQKLLEIGCGIGRDAIPLSSFLTSGAYMGVDIIRPSIEWCADHISKRSPNCEFVHFDVKDQLHNPHGTITTKEIYLPVSNESVDRIFLFSVFTHMFEDDIIHYLKEFKRSIKIDGLVYATTFVFDDLILDKARETNLTIFDLRFEHQISDGCRINNLTFPLGAVAYTLDKWLEMINIAGFRLRTSVIRGGWSGAFENRLDGQDVLVLEPS